MKIFLKNDALKKLQKYFWKKQWKSIRLKGWVCPFVSVQLHPLVPTCLTSSMQTKPTYLTNLKNLPPIYLIDLKSSLPTMCCFHVGTNYHPLPPSTTPSFMCRCEFKLENFDFQASTTLFVFCWFSIFFKNYIVLLI